MRETVNNKMIFYMGCCGGGDMMLASSTIVNMLYYLVKSEVFDCGRLNKFPSL